MAQVATRMAIAAIVGTLALGACKKTTGGTDLRESGSQSGPAGDVPSKNAIFSFVTVGDSREDPETSGLTAQDAKWLQATGPLTRIIKESIRLKAQALFFNGDMINGYTLDRAVTEPQYAYFRGVVSHLLESGVYFVPVPGNHEMQEEVHATDGTVTKTARVELEPGWRENMGDLIIDKARWEALTGTKLEHFSADNSPRAGQAVLPDSELKFQTDQAQLTYSFDAAGIHFVVINTDPVGHDSNAPITWLAEDLKNAKARGTKRTLIFGHKQVAGRPFQGEKKDGLNKFPDRAKAFWRLVNDYQGTYFCGHQHLYYRTQPFKAEDPNGKWNAWQVLVGSGGSPLSVPLAQRDDDGTSLYSFAKVDVLPGARLNVTVYGFRDPHQRELQTIDTFELP